MSIRFFFFVISINYLLVIYLYCICYLIQKQVGRMMNRESALRLWIVLRVAPPSHGGLTDNSPAAAESRAFEPV